VLEAGDEAAAEHTVAAVPSPALAVPASLHASLMARLDRLGPAKEVAQVGAAIGREFSHALLAVVTRKPEIDLGAALDRLIGAGLLFRQGVPPHAAYLFKHALVQDAAYGTLLREPRRALHARIAEALEGQFAEIVESKPELLARHCSEAGLAEQAAGLWGKAGQQSLAGSALIEAIAQFTRALDLIAALPATPALRREQIRLQVALVNPLMHVKGYSAPETQAAVERARLLIERAEKLGETPDDPLLLFLVLYGFWTANYLSFEGDVCCDLADHFLALAEKQGATVPRVIGHRIMGHSLTIRGDIVEAQGHYDRAITLYDPTEHRHLAARFSADASVMILIHRAWNLWLLGYPTTALRDANEALKNAREIDQAVSLMFALFFVARFHILCGNYSAATALTRELCALADGKGATLWKAMGTLGEGWILALTGNASEAIRQITIGRAAYRSTGSTLNLPPRLSYLSLAHANMGQPGDAWRCIGEAISMTEATKERWFEAETNRIAGKIALKSPEPDAAKAEVYFERSLAVARQQKAKSWELRASMSLARLWHDQGKVQQARELLAPVYGWFTEGFDTRDLKEAKALLEELAS
jgi:predicted ATPase